MSAVDPWAWCTNWYRYLVQLADGRRVTGTLYPLNETIVGGAVRALQREFPAMTGYRIEKVRRGRVVGVRSEGME